LSRVDSLSSAYVKRIERLRIARTHAEELVISGDLKVNECCLLYESLLLNAITGFEGVLEDLFTEFVCGTQPRRTAHYATIKPKSKHHFRKILLQGGRYRDYLPYKDKMLKLSKLYLNEGKPFTDVPAADRDLLADIIKTRNAIAHGKGYALDKYRSDVNGVTSLSPSRQFPGPFLRYVYKMHPDETYLELYLTTLGKVSNFLSNQWK
jgi:hypothetical protein